MGGFPTQVLEVIVEVCYSISTANKCYFGNGMSLLRPESYRALKGLQFYVQLSTANVKADGYFFVFKILYKYHVFLY